MWSRRWRCVAAAALTGVLVLGFAGCGEPGKTEVPLDPDNPISIEIWHYYNGPQKIAFDQLVAEFNESVGAEKGIVIEAFSQGNVSDLTNKVIDAAEKKVGAKAIPDIFAAYPDTAYRVDQLGLVANLDKYLTKAELDEYLAAYIEEGRFDKERQLKIFPTAKSTEVFMLNKTDWDKFAAATGAKLDDLKTMEGLAATAKAYYEWTDSLTAAPDDGKAFFGRDAMANYMLAGCKELGVEIFEIKDSRVTLHCDETVLRRLWDNFYIPFIQGHFAALGKFRSDDAKTGDIIALVGSTSGSAYFPDKVMVGDTESYPIEALVLAPPVFEGGDKVAIQQGAGMVVTKSEPAKEYASVVFLKWFTEEDRNIAFSTESGYLPVKKAANDAGRITDALDRLESSTVVSNLRKALPVSVEMTNTHTLYTTKAFHKGTEARDVLETSMIGQAKADLKEIRALMDQQTSRSDAIARFQTDEHFRQWLEAFREALEKTIQ